jgi:hypothetical protein
MFNVQQYSERMTEAERRAEIAPTPEIRQSWINVQLGWQSLIRTHQDILSDRPEVIRKNEQ